MRRHTLLFGQFHIWARAFSANSARCRASSGYSGRARDDTIYALSTAPGPAAIAVIRMSGPLCSQIYSRLCPSKPLPKPRMAAVRALYSPENTRDGDSAGCLDPSALVLYFPGPKSFTGQDMLELHVHGGVATVKAVMSALPRCVASSPVNHSDKDRHRAPSASPIRPANPGEFTQLAFYAGRLSLPQVESLSAVLSASTEQARVAAIRGSNTVLTDQYELWRSHLIGAMGECEALIDFSEDYGFDDGHAGMIQNIRSHVTNILRQIQTAKENGSRGELMRDGIRVALLGRPNAGKSSLLNRIVGREAAIVSAEAGTTRDVVEVSLDLGGWLIRLGDTAGLRGGRVSLPHNSLPSGQEISPSTSQSSSQAGQIGFVEQEGIRRAKRLALESDVVLVILSVEESTPTSVIDPEIIDVVRQLHDANRVVLFALNKVDTLTLHDRAERVHEFRDSLCQLFLWTSPENIVSISCLDPDSHNITDQDIQSPGINSLTSALISTFAKVTATVYPDSVASSDFSPSPTFWQECMGITARQQALIQTCELHLNDFLDVTHPVDPDNRHNQDIDIVIAAEHLRSAADSLSSITGRCGGGDVEDILGVVFEKFCVGK